MRGFVSRYSAILSAFAMCRSILRWSVLIPRLTRKQSKADGTAPTAAMIRNFLKRYENEVNYYCLTMT